MTSRTTYGRYAGLALLATLGACAAGISYSHDSDPSASMGGYRTYIWAQSPEAAAGGAEPRGVNTMLERRIIQAVDQQLQAKGYRLSTSAEGDFAVNFMITTSQQTDYNTYYTGMGYAGGWYGGMGMGSSQTRAYVTTTGTFILDVFDVRSRQLVWRGTAKGTIEEQASPEQREMRIQEAVGGTLRPFPARQP